MIGSGSTGVDFTSTIFTDLPELSYEDGEFSSCENSINHIMILGRPTLNLFQAKSVDKGLPFFKILQEGKEFE